MGYFYQLMPEATPDKKIIDAENNMGLPKRMGEISPRV
jgi:hypothetical protein